MERYLRRCLNSLVNQTLENIEVIVVNDGSLDGSQKIIDEFKEQYPFKIKGYIKQNGGLSSARNYGLKLAKGKYIGFVDGDDYADKAMYEKLYNRSILTEADIVVCGYYAVSEDSDESREVQTGNMQHYNKSVFDNSKLLYINCPYAWNKIFKKTLFESSSITFPKGMIFEDICTVYPLFIYANKIAKVDECLYYYYIKREGSITGTYSEKSIQILLSLTVLNSFFKKAELFDEFKEILLFINLRHIFNRIFEYRLYSCRSVQLEYLYKGFEHLNEQFPGWVKDNFYFDFYFGNKFGVKKHLYRKRWFWKIIIYTPNSIIKKFEYLVDKFGGVF